ncbi:MAG TPA: hypothetical protein VKX96_04115 [Chloroflexota bacterium]|nr:hypothetical protein [Chloroflexota bacterium]
MINPFTILWKSVVDVYGELFPMVGMNVLWLILSIPIVLVVTLVLMLFKVPGELALPIALLFALLAPSPSSVGIQNYVNQLVKEERVEFDLFWAGLRTLWRPSLILLGISVFGTALLGVNLMFYLSSSLTVLHYFAILWLYAIVVWIIMMLYMNPLLVEQENKSIKLIVRNSFLLAVDNVIPSLVLVVVLLVLSAVSIGITLLVALLTASLAATVETRAVLSYLEKYRLRAAKQSS